MSLLSLFSIVVMAGVVLIDFANRLVRTGMPVKDHSKKD